MKKRKATKKKVTKKKATKKKAAKKKAASRVAKKSSRKKPTTRKAQSSPAKANPAKASPGTTPDKLYLFPETGIDLSDAVVRELLFDVNDLVLVIGNAEIVGFESLNIVIRFGAVQGFLNFFFDFHNRLYDTHKRKWEKPKVKLRELTFKNSKKLYANSVTLGLAPWRSPVKFNCKRVTVSTEQGALIAGDMIPPKSKYRNKDYKAFAEQAAQLIEDGEYGKLRALFHPSLAKKHPLDKLTSQLDRWSKLRSFSGGIARRGKTFFATVDSYDDGRDRLTDAPKTLDPDIVRMQATVEFVNRFHWTLLLVEEQGKLAIGHYSLDRDW